MAKYLLATMWFLSGLALLVLPSSVSALFLPMSAWNEVRFTADTNINIPGVGITLIASGGSNVSSLEVLSDRIRITGAHVDAVNRSSITLVSNQRHIIRNGWGLPTTCNPTFSAVTITWAPTSAGSIDVFPSPSDLCGPVGGGGFVSGKMPDPVPTPPPTPVPVGMTIEEMRVEIARITALIATLQAQLAARVAIAAPQPFVSDLHFGMRNNPDVRRLQEFLIQRGHLASGFNTGNFLSLTREAVRAYQQAKGITPSTGNFGPRTRAAVNAELGVSQ